MIEREKENEIILEENLHKDFVDYSEETTFRAIPNVYDGLKPVHRRILYSMHELNITYDTPYKKSARVVGDTLGRFHPHGDTAVYYAMVRKGQYWNERYPLIDMQGNIGSIDGDGPAQMRYTESRMEKFANSFFVGLNKNCVKWNLNFDDSLYEPAVLPTIAPNYLLNGGYGIAVGKACNMPTHNLCEVANAIYATLDNPDITVKELLEHIKGPDLPTGGVVESSNFLKMYETGKGTFKNRAKYKIEKIKGGRHQIIFDDIPFGEKKEKILEQLGELKVDGVTNIVDDSDIKGSKIVVEIKKDIDPYYILENIFSNTLLEKQQKFDMVTMTQRGPKRLNLKSVIEEYILFQKHIVLKQSTYDIEKLEKRLSIQEGYLVAINNIDKVIEVIRKSKNTTIAKTSLMEEFNLSEEQAKSIIDMNLGRLTNLEIDKINKTIKSIKSDIKKLNNIIKNDNSIKKEIKRKLTEFVEEFGDERRTIIQDKFEKIEGEKPIVNSYVVIKDKNINVFKNRTFKYDKGLLLDMDSTQDLIIFLENGEFKKFNLDTIENKTLINIVGAFSSNFKNDERILTFVTKKGLIKRTSVNDFNISRKQAVALNLDKDDSLLRVFIDSSDNQQEGINLFGLTDNNIDTSEQKETVLDEKDLELLRREDKTRELLLFTDKGNYTKIYYGDLVKVTGRMASLKPIITIYGDEKVLFVEKTNVLSTIILNNKRNLNVEDLDTYTFATSSDFRDFRLKGEGIKEIKVELTNNKIEEFKIS